MVHSTLIGAKPQPVVQNPHGQFRFLVSERKEVIFPHLQRKEVIFPHLFITTKLDDATKQSRKTLNPKS